MALKGGFTHIMPAGTGYDTRTGGFGRTLFNVLVRLAPKEHAKPGHVICYDEVGERFHTRKNLLRTICSECNNPAGQCCHKE